MVERPSTPHHHVERPPAKSTWPRNDLAGSSRLPLYAVMELHQPIFEPFDGVQVQRYVAVTPRDEWNAVPNEHRDDTDDELVDRPLVEKGRDELTAAHQPDVLAGLLSKAA